LIKDAGKIADKETLNQGLKLQLGDQFEKIEIRLVFD